MGNHDANYKRLFSHPRMMEDFLRAFVREPWVADLDFSTLENLGADFVTEEGGLRDGDVVWRVKFRGSWLYVCVLLEFQSTVDPRMALRMTVYVGLLYQKLIRLGLIQPGEKLPLVLPVVLYSGKPRWNAARDVLDLILAAPAGLERYQPRMQYFLLDQGRLDDSELGSWQNLSAALFRLERSRGEEEIRRVVEAMAGVLEDHPELQSLEEAFADWLHQKEFEQGLEQGLEQARQGLFEVVLGLLEWRFGSVDEGIRDSLEERSFEELIRLAKSIPQASSLDELGLR